ncbi:PEP-CTERM sorting domain-containing protein [Microcoleus vaginatus GB1-A2]|uniref:PEP-CTERM sorting domain-containing protein n=1 Tax=Microcoleus vaginatus TaxID=119532 RepID=UPI0016864CBE|nr:PEP-CTERM sorting domain-containing protein [Microcoleus sp. FACHB-61]
MTTLTLVKKTSFTVASLATTMLLSICTPVRAFMFGTGGIQFDRDTNINFTFEESHGGYQSSLWVAQAQSANTGYTNIARLFYETKPSDNASADDWQGTFGNAVTSENGSITQTFTFLQDQIYALLLWSDTGTGQPLEQYVSSSSFMNSPEWFAAGSKFQRDDCLVGGCQQAVFGNFLLDPNSNGSFTNINGANGPGQYSFVTMAELAQGTQISFDDAGGNDQDFQDFTVLAQLASETMTQQAQRTPISLGDRPGNNLRSQDLPMSAELASEPVPEPVTVFGTMLGLGALAAARRKKKRGQQR